jgi:hypothetical protein
LFHYDSIRRAFAHFRKGHKRNGKRETGQMRLIGCGQRMAFHHKRDDIGVDETNSHGSTFLLAGGPYRVQKVLEISVVIPQVNTGAQQMLECCGPGNSLFRNQLFELLSPWQIFSRRMRFFCSFGLHESSLWASFQFSQSYQTNLASVD